MELIIDFYKYWRCTLNMDLLRSLQCKKIYWYITYTVSIFLSEMSSTNCIFSELDYVSCPTKLTTFTMLTEAGTSMG
jgi:hypothetical protein